ncbi:glycosyltransferase [Archaeoglobus profundus]|uniref:Glycosyl transferase family 2 n=1 Tax=Archaeoglobus profundus (strain DSM 5631 / JCM 9629 / NBRC 100127 / Av18) TaxID=572546 RepID=D2RH47_ARCPA|nr:glycosyltransferase family 2 protein [Archaeoglobus profundus]ADB57622.1 glycosyl transferase family 2 [Archaeoglobus profundus DSM 5631]
MKVLVVILNKDNAEGLERCLKSLKDQTYKNFDVLVLDGKSKDNSKEIAEKYGVMFKVQNRLGGTGFARVEGCEFALKRGYDAVIWGDSENVYDKRYIEEMVKALKNYDIVGGVPILEGSFLDHAFAWYHAIHLIVPKLYRRHAPGNNKAEKTWIYREIMYPTSVRAEDYGFSLLLLKNGLNVKCGLANAKVVVSLPRNLKDVLAWQSARAKGVAQALKMVGFKPYDVLAWSLLIFMIPLLAFNLEALIIYALILLASSIAIHFKSKRFIRRFRWFYFIAPLIGFAIHSIYSIKALIHYMRWSNERLD